MSTPAFQSILTNASFVAGSRVVAMASRAVYVVLLARLLGPDVYGAFVYGHSWYLVFLPLASLGLAGVLGHHIGRDSQRLSQIVARATALRGFTCLLAMVACIGIGLALEPDPLRQHLLLVFGLALAGRGLGMLTEQIFIATESARFQMLQEGIFRPLETVLAIAVMVIVGDVVWVAAVHAVVWWAQAINGLILVHRRIAPVAPDWGVAGMWTLARPGLPSMVSHVGSFWLFQGAVVLFRHASTDAAAVGQLGLAMQVIMLALILPFSLGAAAIPVVSRAAGKQDGTDLRFFGGMVRIGLLTGAAAGVVGVGLGPLLVDLIVGEAYALTGSLIGLALWMLAPMTVAISGTKVLMGQGRFAAAAVTTGFGCAALTATFWPLAAAFGAWGAMAATAAGTTVWAVAVGWTIGWRSGFALLSPVVRAGATAVAAAVTQLALTAAGPIIALTAALMVLAVTAIALRAVNETDWELVRRAMPRRRPLDSSAPLP